MQRSRNVVARARPVWNQRGRWLVLGAVAIGSSLIGAGAVTIATPAAPTIASDPIRTRSTFVPTADAFVARTTTLQHSSQSQSLQVGGRSRAATFLQFSIQGLPGVVTHATLKLYVMAFSPTRVRVTVASAAGSIEDPTATVPTAVSRTESSWLTISSIGWASVEVGALVAGNGPLTLKLSPWSGSGVQIGSREAEAVAPSLSVEVDPVLLAVGDLAACSDSGNAPWAAAVASAIEPIAGIFAPLGDLAYPHGTPAEFANCFDPWFRPLKDRTRPSPGNHESDTPRSAGYFGYYGDLAGNSTRGYYSYELGTWHVVVLNSNCWDIGGCGPTSAEVTWLRDDLAQDRTPCSLAYWHQPLFGSGPYGRSPEMLAVWQALYEYGVDVVLNGHAHHYERFAPQSPAGVRDSAGGIREFIVGTGGAPHFSLEPVEPNSEVRDNTTFGFLAMTLRAGSYDWRFVPAADGTFQDAGTATCH